MKIAVLFGGTSAERDVSIASGTQVAQALREAGHDILAVDTTRGILGADDERRLLAAGVDTAPPAADARDLVETGDLAALTREAAFDGTDLVFVALHGGAGEDGRLQALLDLAGLPYTGSGHIGSALAMDKDVSKYLFRAAGVPTAEWLMAPVDAARVAAEVGYPLVSKPSKQGSTVGLTVVRSPDGLDEAVTEAFRHDDEVMLERFVHGRELTVPILGGEALPVGEIIPKNEIFDYECKYQPGMAEEIFPADLPEALAERIRALGLRAHRALKLRGYSRVDFRLDEDGTAWCLEANTSPGMSAMSLFPKAGRAVGVEFPELCDRICRFAIEEHRARRGG